MHHAVNKDGIVVLDVDLSLCLEEDVHSFSCCALGRE